jgi:hypothetical protein
MIAVAPPRRKNHDSVPGVAQSGSGINNKDHKTSRRQGRLSAIARVHEALRKFAESGRR